MTTSSVRGVILAGGMGLRMAGLMRDRGVKNKHLLPVGNDERPLVCHALGKLTAASVRDVLLVTSPDGVGPLGRLLGSGALFDCRVSYRVQDRPGGIVDALLLAEDFARGAGRIVVVLGDNLWEVPLPAAMLAVDSRAWVALSRVPAPERFGVATLDPSTRGIASLVEKPSSPDSDLAVTGIYSYPPGVFDLLRSLSPSARGELEITDLNRLYLSAGRLEYVTLPGWWQDAGTPEGLAEADRLCREQPPLW